MKKGKNNLTGFLARKQFRYGSYATVLTAVVIAVVILLNVAIGAIEANWALTIDVTAMGATEFSEETEKVVSEVVAGDAKSVADFKSGKEKALMALFGKCMKQLKGNCDPQVLRESLIAAIDKA